MIQKTKIIKDQINRTVSLLKERIYTKIADLTAEGYLSKEPLPFSERTTGKHRRLNVGDSWGSLFDCAWFHITGTVPGCAKGEKVVLMIDLNGEGCVYDSGGCPVRGITNVASEYDHTLGMPGKRVLQFQSCSSGNEPVDLWIDAGCNDLFGKFQGSGQIVQLDIAVCNDNAQDLYYDMILLDDMLDCLDPDSARYYAILYALENAVMQLSDFEDAEYLAARKILKKELDKAGGTPSLSFYAIGHAHLDLAWLWPIRETKRKGARTFSTALELMDRYPDYLFGASQPQLFEWIEQDHPDLFAKIKQKIKEGRIEVQGGMWVESDTNLPNGESLVRQFLYGKRYFREQFDKDVRYLWLPDAFGFSAALPQIIKKSGCDYFTTIKLSWNSMNPFPYHTFHWAGIDGSRVLVHMPPEGNYNSAGLPHSYIHAQKAYREKGLCDKALCLFGIGDGGGGPGPEHLERIKRLKNLEGIPPVKQAPVQAFYDAIATDSAAYPSYADELYLEKHQGTFTSQANIKKANRLLERKLHEAELLSTQAYLKSGKSYPHEALQKIWKEVLLYQFHDILPGTCIKRVYDEALERQAALAEEIDQLSRCALDCLYTSKQLSVYNPLSWQRTQLLKTDGGYVQVTVPAFGFAPVETGKKVKYRLQAAPNRLENELIRVELSESGFITSIYDKECQRECIPQGAIANELVLFTDIGDAWDFPANYRDLRKAVFALKEQTFYADSGYAVLSSTYRFGNSTLHQDVVLEGGTKRIDFKTTVDWHETNKMLRAEFPLAIAGDTVSCDIQFGHIRRSTKTNNRFDAAQTEIVAHKWIDRSEADYGVSLLNDCKYGYYAKGSLLSINLLRSQNYPCENQDKGRHTFCYALYPHSGSVFQSDVERQAYEYNVPLLHLPQSGSAPMIAQPEKGNIVLETVKMSENGDGVILRIYEAKGKAVDCTILLNENFKKCILTNLIEDDIEPLPITDSRVTLHFNRFEIHTLRVR